MLKNLRKGDRYANCKIKAMCIHEGSHTAAGGVQRGFMKALGGTERQKALKKPRFVEEWPRLGLGSENHGRWKIFQV